MHGRWSGMLSLSAAGRASWPVGINFSPAPPHHATPRHATPHLKAVVGDGRAVLLQDRKKCWLALAQDLQRSGSTEAGRNIQKQARVG